MFAASNRNIIKNNLKEEIRTNFVKKLQFSISNFNLHNYICIIMSDDVIQ